MSEQFRVVERVYDATIDDVWEMWTTVPGIEAWWGPDGFAVTVDVLDLRVGGTLRYVMRAVAPEMVAFMKRSGMATATPCSARYTIVDPPRRLALSNVVDFVPDHPTYESTTDVELVEEQGKTRVIVRVGVMHDAEWTGRAVAGWTNELEKLARALG